MTTVFLLLGVLFWLWSGRRLWRAYLILEASQAHFAEGQRYHKEAIARNEDAITQRQDAASLNLEANRALAQAQAIYHERIPE